jgi:hypothetical protein
MSRPPNPATARIRNPATAEFICSKIADGFTLRQIAKELDCEASAITDWVRHSNDFAAQYARAREVQAEKFADELVEIADDGANDWYEREGIELPDHEHIQRSRLRADTRKWLMSKMLPKKYGDRLVNEHVGAGGGPVELAVLTPAERAERQARAEALIDDAFKALPKPEDVSK